MTGRDWLPELPLGWQAQRADAVLEYRKTPARTAEFESAEVFHYSIPSIQETGDGVLQNGSEIESDKISLNGGELIVSKLNPRKGCVMLTRPQPFPIVCSTEFVPLVARPGFDSRFAFYVYISTPIRELISAVVQSVTRSHQRANPDDITKIWIPVPPPFQQHAIADYLDRETARLDALVAAKERVLGLLAEKRRALITRAVTRGLDPRAPLRDSGIPWLGEIPAHWELCHLKRVLATIDYGISESVGPVGAVAVLRMGDIQDGEVEYSKLGFVDAVDQALLLRPGDLLFNRTNSLEQIGKVALFRGKADYPVSYASYLVRLRCGSRVLPEFLNWLLNSAFPVAWGRSEALPAIGQANLNPNRYGYLPMALPPLEEQKDIIAAIHGAIGKLDAVRAATERTIILLKERRAALIAAAVTGQIDAADFPAPVEFAPKERSC